MDSRVHVGKQLHIIVKNASILFLGLIVVVLLWLGLNRPAKPSALIGRVTTSGGQAVPMAEVILLHSRASLSVSTLTNADGVYGILYLPVDSYSLQVRKTGFAPFVRSEVKLQAGQTVSINVVLAVDGP